MSLTLLPSVPMACGQSASPKRPKLSLNTTNTHSLFGKKSTSLRLETLSATSPTTLNTFSNGYNAGSSPRTPSVRPRKPSLTPLATNILSNNSSPLDVEHPDSAESSDLTSSSAVSTSSVSTFDSSNGEIPYKLSCNVASILTNGPYPKSIYRRMSFSQSRPMFPAAKKVTFRTPLTEDVRNTQYTMSNADLDASSSTISTLELSPPEEMDGTEKGEANALKEGVKSAASLSPTVGEKRESSDEDESDKCVATPIAGRRKRHRQWRWTLGPAGSEPTEEVTEDSERNDVEDESE